MTNPSHPNWFNILILLGIIGIFVGLIWRLYRLTCLTSKPANFNRHIENFSGEGPFAHHKLHKSESLPPTMQQEYKQQIALSIHDVDKVELDPSQFIEPLSGSNYTTTEAKVVNEAAPSETIKNNIKQLKALRTDDDNAASYPKALTSFAEVPLAHERSKARIRFRVSDIQTHDREVEDGDRKTIEYESRIVRVTEVNLRNYHLHLPLDFFPADAIGGDNLNLVAPKKITVSFKQGPTIESDIDGKTRILRNQLAIQNFFLAEGIKEGDLISIIRRGLYSYEFSKELSNPSLERDPLLQTNEIVSPNTKSNNLSEVETIDIFSIPNPAGRTTTVAEETPSLSKTSLAAVEEFILLPEDIASHAPDTEKSVFPRSENNQKYDISPNALNRNLQENSSELYARKNLTERESGETSKILSEKKVSDVQPNTYREQQTSPLGLPPTASWANLGQKWQNELFGNILSRNGLERPDGRPLYSYTVTSDDITALEKFLARRMRSVDPLQSTGAAFVFWAAEHIRAKYPRLGERHLSWTFLFDAFGIPEEPNYARRLVQLGLKWWQRSVRQAENGNNLYLFSLLLEGGLPEALLTQEGLYRRVVLGLVEDVDREGGIRASSTVVAQIAERRLMALPQTFQSVDFVRLFAELGNALSQLRAALPVDLQPEFTEAWLAANHPNWQETLPLRASAEAIRRLIVPALQIERAKSDAGGPIITRELRRDRRGHWHGNIRFSHEFWIPGLMFPDGTDLRLRLIPAGALVRSVDAPTLFAAPERNGWRTRLLGKSGPVVTRLDLTSPVVFTAFADGKSKGEIEFDTGLPDPAETISLWRPDEGADPAAAETLTLSAAGRTRAPCLWALASPDIHPSIDGDLTLEGPEPAKNGQLWRVSGKGVLIFGENRLSIETQAESDGEEARLVAIGHTLNGWKTARGRGLVFLGRPTIYGQRKNQTMTALTDRNLVIKNSRGRTYAQCTAEWIENGETLNRLRYIALPSEFIITTRETAGGEARISINDFGSDPIHITARAGDASAKAILKNGSYDIILKTPGAPPGEIQLQISNPVSGASIDLVAPWPARQAMLLDATGTRLTRQTALAVESLGEIRAITPPGMSGGLNIALKNAPKLTQQIIGETSLGAHQAIIRALLAQGGPDAQVDVWLEMNGLRQGPKLEVRRYADNAVIRGDILRAGLDRNAPLPPENVFSDALCSRRSLRLHLVDLKNGATQELETTEPCNLQETLGTDGGPWIIQSRLEGRSQRAVFYSAGPTLETTREERIASFSRKFLALAQTPQAPDWHHIWKVIKALSEGGDAGCADQTQAFAHAPEALVMLILKAERSVLVMALELDIVAPIFWPSLPVEAFVKAIQQYYIWRREAHLQAFDLSEAENNAASEILKRVSMILALRPELAAHFGWALSHANLIHRAYDSEAPIGLRESLALARKSLPDLAMTAARRFDSMPTGLKGIAPLNPPHKFDFHENTLAVVNAPVVTAEIAAGLRAVSKLETLQLIGLRLVDPEYFDAAMPVALTLTLEKAQCSAPA